MRRAIVAAAALVAAAVLLTAPAVLAEPGAKRVLMVGDSLAVGTQPYLQGALRGWEVQQTTAISRHAPEGPEILRSWGALPRVLVMSLGTNDDPRAVSTFRAAIRSTLAIAGPRRCVVWVNVVRPAVAGASYAGYNSALAQEARGSDRLRVVSWTRMVRENPHWLAGDGVHVSAEGYRARARAIARAVKNCKPA